MQCCPLGEADETCTLSTRTNRRARKTHKCVECSGEIKPGEIYCYASMLFDGSWSDCKTCKLCEEIGDHFTCGSRVVGELWSDLQENFFPNMKAGGPCMEGLSPAAKVRLFDACLAWKLGQDA